MWPSMGCIYLTTQLLCTCIQYKTHRRTLGRFRDEDKLKIRKTKQEVSSIKHIIIYCCSNAALQCSGGMKNGRQAHIIPRNTILIRLRSVSGRLVAPQLVIVRRSLAAHSRLPRTKRSSIPIRPSLYRAVGQVRRREF